MTGLDAVADPHGGAMSIRSLILLIAPPTVGVAVGYVCGGRLAGLRSIRLSAGWLLWLAAVVQAVQYYVAPLRHPARWSSYSAWSCGGWP